VLVVTPTGYVICHEMKRDKRTHVQCDLFPVFWVGSSERPAARNKGKDGCGISGPDVGDTSEKSSRVDPRPEPPLP